MDVTNPTLLCGAIYDACLAYAEDAEVHRTEVWMEIQGFLANLLEVGDDEEDSS